MILASIVPTATVALFAAAAAGIGGEALRLLRYRPGRTGEATVAALSLGLAIYSVVFFAAGFFDGWTSLGAWMLMSPGLAAFAARFQLVGLHSGLRKGTDAFRRLPGWGKGAAILILALLAAQFLATLAPPSSGDALAYHLELPRIYSQAHRWVYRPDGFFADNPSAVEMLFLACRLVGAEAAAPLVHWIYGVLLAVSLVMFVRDRFPEGSPTVALVAALLVVSMPLYAFEATSAFIDLATAQYTLLGIWLGMRALDQGRADAAWVAGLSAGAAAASKISGIGAWPALVAMALAAPGGRKRWRIAPALIIGALALSLPWFVKAWAFTGNPVWPLFYSRLGGRYWNLYLSHQFAIMMSQDYGTGHGPIALLRLPWDLTRRAVRFDDNPMGMSLFILPCLALPASIRRSTAPLWAALGVYLLTWFFVLSQQARFLLPILPVWAALATDGMSRIAARVDTFRRGWASVLWGALAGATVLFGAAGSLWYCTLELPVVFGVESPDAYLARTYAFYRDARYLNATLPARAKLLVTDRRTYYLDRSYEHDGFYQDVIDYTRLRSADELLHRLKELGITHVWYEAIILPGEVSEETRPAASGTAPEDPGDRYDYLHQLLRRRMHLIYRSRRPVSMRRSARTPDAIADSEVYQVP